ncbi:hypothetical protein D6L13_03755 [Salmonella enterica subsp. enterica serovar Ordonez]|nr:hypothetical protein [Salmonella enterica subsp. enterica serovar Ordonez]
MTNTKLTDERVLQRLSQFEGAYKEACVLQDDDFASECADIVRVLRELQERRKAEWTYCLATLYEIDGVFTKDPTAIANARGRKVQGYVELEVANRFYKGDKD